VPTTHRMSINGAGEHSVGGDGERTVDFHEALVHENPAEGDDQGQDYEKIAGEGGNCSCGSSLVTA